MQLYPGAEQTDETVKHIQTSPSVEVTMHSRNQDDDACQSIFCVGNERMFEICLCFSPRKFYNNVCVLAKIFVILTNLLRI